MNQRQARFFAEAIDKEATIISETFDGTVGAEHFRARVATLYYAIVIFQAATGINPFAFLNNGQMPMYDFDSHA